MMCRMRYKVLGGHTHVRVFCAMTGEHALGKCGDLVFRNEEWAVVAPALEKGAGWQILPEEPGDAPSPVLLCPECGSNSKQFADDDMCSWCNEKRGAPPHELPIYNLD